VLVHLIYSTVFLYSDVIKSQLMGHSRFMGIYSIFATSQQDC